MITQHIITQDVLGRTETVVISNSEYGNLAQAVQKLSNIADVEQKFSVFIDNHVELEQDLLTEALQVMTFFEYLTSALERSRTLISRRIINLLTSARLYIDSLPHHANELLGGQPGLQKVLDAPSNQYDSNLGYRVMEALRNYSQHEALPVHKWSTLGEKDELSKPTHFDYSVWPAPGFVDTRLS